MTDPAAALVTSQRLGVPVALLLAGRGHHDGQPRVRLLAPHERLPT